ncbi:MAG: type II secretion system inner membrane protein GspF [Clostridia bacterium]|nr:type II secretion system inner membrane protein GspF [Deltaproteobacteria bacterium]
MPVYAYKGYTTVGKSVASTREADNERNVKQALRREGIFVTDLRLTGRKQDRAGSAKVSPGPSFLAKLNERISSQELAVATRQLSTLVGAGIPLVESLNALIDQIESEYFRSVWADVKQKVNEGIGLGDALSNHPRIFSGLYINLVRAGETSGALDVVLNRLADFTESQAELRSKLIGSMVYPIIMLFMALGVIAMLFIVVIPRISNIFKSQKVSLPLPTQILIGASTIAKDYGYIAFPFIVLIVWGVQKYFRSKTGRPKWDKFILKAPLFGPLLRMVAIVRFSRTLSTLLGAGVPLLTAFDIVKNVLQNLTLLKVIEDARDAVKEGDSIAAPLRRSKEFPPIVTHMIAIGEKSGTLEEMLGNIAKAYEVQVDARLRAMVSVLEPLMIVGMGIVVAFIVFSILLPMLQLASFAR